ncbi:hypothetical protein FOZ61_008850 [Perkinsus olseni]|uniref:Uncharacterized protein n=1 Tax=Perkinsus olseni TaxID=32597 RepID=A0A7J6L208_PEROL|nr:hypothetical protein FOZ61_008850 [Perkinsus olseni]
MPTTRPSHSAVTLLLFLLALVDLAGASPPSIEAGHYEGLVDPAHPIGTLQGIAMDIRMGGSQRDVPFSTMEFIGETASGEWKVIRINSIKSDRYSRPGDLKVVFIPNDVNRADQCYKPIHIGQQTKRELLRIFDIFSIPGPVRGIAMDIRMGGSREDVPFSTMEFIGETASGEWKVIRINSIKWDRYYSSGVLKVVLSPNDAKRELLKIFDIFSIPGPVRMSNSWQIKLCFVAGNAYIFVGGSARASRYTFIHPLLLERVEERNFEPNPTSTSQARGRGDTAITTVL